MSEFENVQEKEMQDQLAEFLVDFIVEHEVAGVNEDGSPGAGVEEYGIRMINTYEEAGVITTNKGLVIEMGDGSVFQLQIVKSR